MKYKALMLDVDGTLIPYDYESTPSKKLVQAIREAKEKVNLSLITGRSYESTKRIIELFDLKKGYMVFNGGSVVLNLDGNKVIYKKTINHSDTTEIIKILLDEKIEFYIKKDPLKDPYPDGKFIEGDKYNEAYFFFCLEEHSNEKVDRVFNRLSRLSSLTLHKTNHGDPEKFGFNITHAEATKLHGIEIVAKELDLKREEIIGVGDSYNDFPLLMASGLKVAMGNAIEDLKAVADYVAPPVTEDGVVDVIEKYIFSEN